MVLGQVVGENFAEAHMMSDEWWARDKSGEDSGFGRGIGRSGLEARRARDAMWRKLGRQAKGTAKAKAMVAKDAPLPVRWVYTGDWKTGRATGGEVKTIVVRTKKTGVEAKRSVARKKAIAVLFWKCMNIREFFETAGRYYYRTPSALAWISSSRISAPISAARSKA